MPPPPAVPRPHHHWHTVRALCRDESYLPLATSADGSRAMFMRVPPGVPEVIAGGGPGNDRYDRYVKRVGEEETREQTREYLRTLLLMTLEQLETERDRQLARRDTDKDERMQHDVTRKLTWIAHLRTWIFARNYAPYLSATDTMLTHWPPLGIQRFHAEQGTELHTIRMPLVVHCRGDNKRSPLSADTNNLSLSWRGSFQFGVIPGEDSEEDAATAVNGGIWTLPPKILVDYKATRGVEWWRNLDVLAPLAADGEIAGKVRTCKPDGAKLVVYDSATQRFWDAAPALFPERHIALSPDGSCVFLVHPTNGSVRLCTITLGEPLQQVVELARASVPSGLKITRALACRDFARKNPEPKRDASTYPLLVLGTTEGTLCMVSLRHQLVETVSLGWDEHVGVTALAPSNDGYLWVAGENGDVAILGPPGSRLRRAPAKAAEDTPPPPPEDTPPPPPPPEDEFRVMSQWYVAHRIRTAGRIPVITICVDGAYAVLINEVELYLITPHRGMTTIAISAVVDACFDLRREHLWLLLRTHDLWCFDLATMQKLPSLSTLFEEAPTIKPSEVEAQQKHLDSLNRCYPALAFCAKSRKVLVLEANGSVVDAEMQ